MAENPEDTEQWQCSECGFKLSGVSVLKFCPDCGAKQKTEEKISRALRCVGCGCAIQTSDQRLCDKCCHEQKVSEGRVETVVERSSESATTPPHGQPGPPSLVAAQNSSATPSNSTQQVSKTTLQQSTLAELSPQPDSHPNKSKNETQLPLSSQPPNRKNDSIPHLPESPTRVPRAPHPPSSGHHIVQESSGQPPGQEGSGEFSAGKSNQNPNAKSSSSSVPGPAGTNGDNQNGNNTQKQKQPVLHAGTVQVSRVIKYALEKQDCSLTKGLFHMSFSHVVLLSHTTLIVIAVDHKTILCTMGMVMYSHSSFDSETSLCCRKRKYTCMCLHALTLINVYISTEPIIGKH